MYDECAHSYGKLEKEVDKELKESSSNWSVLTENERAEKIKEREQKYDYREMYKKMVRKYKKTNGQAPDPNEVLKSGIRKDTQLIKLRTGKIPDEVNKELREDSVNNTDKSF